MITIAAFVVAAAAGALGRAEAGRRWNHFALPAGTLVVNVSGSFALGLLVDAAPPVLTVAGTGALGAYTTFSSFARDAVALAEQDRLWLAALYVAVSCALGIGAAAGGVAIAGG